MMTPQAAANAKFIVRACNAHDDLLTMLKAAQEYLERHACLGNHGLRAQIGSVLIKAEGR
jgi:hypothetical protein